MLARSHGVLRQSASMDAATVRISNVNAAAILLDLLTRLTADATLSPFDGHVTLKPCQKTCCAALCSSSSLHVCLLQSTCVQASNFALVASGTLLAVDKVWASSRYTARRSDTLGSVLRFPSPFALNAPQTMVSTLDSSTTLKYPALALLSWLH